MNKLAALLPPKRMQACAADAGGPGRGRIGILATGGTIVGVGAAGKTTGYRPGALTAEELLRDVPELFSLAEIETIQLCNINSDDMTAEMWLALARTINERAADPDVLGFVITHGTDTMEETAYFLNLTVKTAKPVVITGSMRPATAISADGPLNLYEAVCVARSREAIGQGVLIWFSDRIYAARSVTKTSTYHVMAISAATIDPKRVGGNLESAHAVLAGLDPANEIGFAMAFGKLFTVHLNDQNGIRYDQDKSFGVENLRQAFNQVKALVENHYGSRGEDGGLEVKTV